MSGARRQPDPQRRGKVYRSRPRLWAKGRGLGEPPPRLRPGVPGTDRGDPAPLPGEGQDPYRADRRAAGSPSWGSDRAPAYRPGAGAEGSPPAGPRRRPSLTGTGRRPRIRRRWVVLAVVVLLVAYPVALFEVAWSHLGKVAAMPSGARPAATPGRTYLVVGSDSRATLSAAERKRLGTGRAVGGRTDTIMLLHVSAGGGPTVLVSVPRDSYVSIPGHGKNKINAAYAFGGPQLLVRTIEQDTGVHVDEYVETGLGGYADLVDAVGGITVNVKRAMNDAKAHINLKAGVQQMDGKTALGYARARYSDPRGDLGRVERQRQVLAAIAGKTLSPSVVVLPWRSLPAAAAGGNALVVDDGTSPWGLAKFILAMRDVAGGGGLSLTVPISNPNLTTPAGSSVQWNNTKAKALFTALIKDDTEAVRPLAEAQKKTNG